MDVDHNNNNNPLHLWVMCTYCSRCYPNMERFNEHRHLHNNSQNQVETESESDDENPGVICTICKRSYSSDYNLKRHRRRVHGIRVLTQSKQKVRVVSSPGSRPMKICSICKKSYSSGNIRRHERDVHGIERPLKMTSKVSKKTQAHPRKHTKPTKAKGTPKKGRSAPRKPNTPIKVKVDEEGTPKRGRGRPRNPNTPKKVKVEGRGRGRPRKVPIPSKSPKLFDNVEVKPKKKAKNVNKKESRQHYCSICQKGLFNEYAQQRHNRLFHYLDGKKLVKFI